MGFIDSVAHFVIGFVTGTVGIHFGALYVTGSSTWETAAMTAVAGAFIWAVASLFFGWIPLLGSLLTLAIWVFAISQIYGVGYGTAIEIGLFAWIASFIVTKIESFLGLRTDAVGVPGA
jgi:hypothetical protein